MLQNAADEARTRSAVIIDLSVKPLTYATVDKGHMAASHLNILDFNRMLVC